MAYADNRPASTRRPPGVWQGVQWAFDRGSDGGGASRWRLVARAIGASLVRKRSLARWMGVVHEHMARGLVDDREGEYLRAIRPYVNRHMDVEDRVAALIDHVDWLETALKPDALERLAAGKPVVLVDLRAPRSFEYARVQLRRSGVQSPEGELLLTLTVQRAPDVQHKSLPVEVAALAFSRFRVEGTACLVIGGVRGQRSNASRLSPMEIAQVLQGWKPSVLLVRVMQELARAWNHQLIGLDPAAHRLQGWSYRWQGRHRAAAERIYESYEALWHHFDAKDGPLGWVRLPLQSDEKLAATALSPERRERQSRRADYWIRTRRELRMQMREILLRQGQAERLSRVTQAVTDHAPLDDDWNDLFGEAEEEERDAFQSRVLQTGPINLI